MTLRNSFWCAGSLGGIAIEQPRRIHGGVSRGSSSSSLSRMGNRSISTRGRAPDADFNQTIARRIDHSISFDVR